MEEFRKLVRLLIQEISLKEKQKLLAEPDVPEGEEEEEVYKDGNRPQSFVFAPKVQH